MNDIYKFFTSKVSEIMRHEQALTVLNALETHFEFDYVEIIETGCSSSNYDNFGIFLGKFGELYNGKLISVDINENFIESSKKMYSDELPNLQVIHHLGDSVNFLKSYTGDANLFHLDSFDLDLFNPMPSMLHGLLEFLAIEEKAPKGSICIIDDNWLKGTYIDSVVYVDGVRTNELKRIDIEYDIIGKGGLVYHYVKQNKTSWEIIGDHYKPGNNIKLIFKKVE